MLVWVEQRSVEVEGNEVDTHEPGPLVTDMPENVLVERARRVPHTHR